jgi:Rieske Fe-S protein
MTFNDTETDEAPKAAVAGPTSRRTVLRGAGVVGAAAVAATLAACGSDSSGGSTDTTGSGGAASTPSAPSGGASASTGGSTGGGGLTSTADIPVNGGKVFPDQKVVVTQPASGQFKAFTAVCTHMGCTVASVSNNTIMCPCHGSEFSAADGSVKQGPAASPLAAKKITVSGDQITLG